MARGMSEASDNGGDQATGRGGPRRRRRWPWVLAALLLLLGGLAGGAAWYAFRHGPEVLRTALEAALASPPTRLKVGTVRIDGLSRIILRDVALHDRQGVWAEAPEIEIRWRPRELLQRTAHIRAVKVPRLAVTRIPAGEPSDDAPQPLDWPRTPVTVLLDDLAVGELVLPLPPEDGREAEVVRARLGGTFALFDGGLAAAADLARIDGQPDRLTARAEIDESKREIAVRVSLRSGMSGFVSRWIGNAGLPVGPGGVDLVIGGKGTPEDWNGLASLDLDQAASLRARISSREADGRFRLGAEGRLELAGPMLDGLDLPPDIRILAGEPLSFAGNVVIAEAEPVTARFAMSTPREEFAFQATGGKPWADWKVALRAQPTTPVVEGMTFDLLAAEGAVTLEPAGAVRADLELAVENLIGDGFALPAGTARIDLVRSDEGITISGKGSVSDLMTVAHQDFALPRELQWRLAGSFDGAEQLKINDFVLVGGTLAASARGDFVLTPGSPTGAGEARLEIADLAAVTNGAVHGRADLSLKARTRDGLEVAITGTADGLRHPDSPNLAAVNPVRLEGRVRYGKGGGSGDVAVQSPAFSITADGLLEDGTINVQLQATPGDQQAIATLIGRRLAEGAELRAGITGRAASPDIRVGIRIPELGRGATALRNFRAWARLRDLNGAARGSLRFSGDGVLGPMSGLMRLNRPSEDRIELRDILIDTALATFTGEFTANPDEGRLVGHLDGISGDLAVLQRGLDVEAQGAFSLRLDATADDAGGALRQEVSLVVQGQDMSLVLADREAVTARALEITAALATDGGLMSPELLRKADGAAVLTGFQSSTLLLDRLSFGFGADAPAAPNGTPAAQGSAYDIPWRLDLQGSYFGDVALAGRGNLSFAEERLAVSLTRLDGTIRERALSLRAPATVTIHGPEIVLDRFDLAYGAGGMTARYAANADRLELDVQANDLDLSIVPFLLDLPPFDGSASGDVALKVAGGKAEGRLALSAAMRGTEEGAEDGPVTVRIDGDLAPEGKAGHYLTLKGAASGGDLNGRLDAHLPFAVAGADMPALDFERPLAVDFHWDGPISLITAALPPMDHVVGGRLDADLALSGSVNDPVFRGNLRLADGRYEHVIFGTVFERIAADVALDGRTITLRSLTATDGSDGRLEGAGEFTLADDWRPVGAIEVTLNSARVARTAMVTAEVGGTASYRSRAAASRIAGDLTLDPVEVRLVDQLPPEITTLEVREVNRPGGDDPVEEGAPEIAPITLIDIKLTAPRRVWVRGRGLDSEWQGDLAVRGLANSPSLVGNLTLLRGTFEFAGRDFTLTQGVLRFTGGQEINPLINLRAEYSANNLTAVIAISGPVSKPEIELTSNPALPQDEILARILFGSSVHQLSALEAVQLGGAISSLSSGGGFDVFGKARGLLGLDRLSVGLGENGENNMVTGGKYLTKNVYLEVSTDTETGESKATVRFDVTRNLQLQSDVGGQTSGVGVRWKKDY